VWATSESPMLLLGPHMRPSRSVTMAGSSWSSLAPIR